MLSDNNTITVSFGSLIKSSAAVTFVHNVNPLSHDDAKVFSPEAPTNLRLSQEQGHFALTFEAQSNSKEEPLVFNIYQDGKLIAKGLKDKNWKDTGIADQTLRHCFSVESEFVSSGHKSLHAEPVCNMGTALQTIAVTDKRVHSNVKPTRNKHYAQALLIEWGNPKDTLTFNRINIKQPGLYAIQVRYNNRQHTIDSGVTNAVKTISITHQKNQHIQTGIVQMPNVQDLGDTYPINNSTEFTAPLAKGEYKVELSDYFNMSYLAANQTYKGNGGLAGPVNTASIAGITLVKIE